MAKAVPRVPVLFSSCGSSEPAEKLPVLTKLPVPKPVPSEPFTSTGVRPPVTLVASCGVFPPPTMRMVGGGNTPQLATNVTGGRTTFEVNGSLGTGFGTGSFVNTGNFSAGSEDPHDENSTGTRGTAFAIGIGVSATLAEAPLPGAGGDPRSSYASATQRTSYAPESKKPLMPKHPLAVL